jgi:hypothetical protein
MINPAATNKRGANNNNKIKPYKCIPITTQKIKMFSLCIVEVKPIVLNRVCGRETFQCFYEQEISLEKQYFLQVYMVQMAVCIGGNMPIQSRDFNAHWFNKTTAGADVQ